MIAQKSEQGVFMGTFRAVVFDLDGTLIDSAPDLRVAVNKLLSEQGRRPVSLHEVKMMVGDGAAKLVERAFAATGTEPAASELPDLTARFLAFYEGHAADHTRPYPGVTETLSEFRSSGLALGVCTNKPEAATREVLRDLNLDGYFDAVLGGDSIEGVRKPDPRILQDVLDAMGVVANGSVMVGDAANDVGVARALGVPVVLLSHGYTRTPVTELGADLIISQFSELPGALDRLP
jgi:phosphoglycolate phosphatase